MLVTSGPAVRRMLATLLGKIRQPNVVVLPESRYATARERLLANECDVLLLCEQAEGGSALAFLQSLQNQSDWYPIVFVHGGSDNSVAVDALRQGAQDVLSLGTLSSEHLGIVLRRVLHTSDLRKQNQRFSEELARSNRELEQFAHSVSHDLREPLRKVHSFGELLSESLSGRATSDEQFYLERITDASQRMDQMIQALLAYGLSGRHHESARWIAIADIFTEVQRDLELAIAECNAHIVLQGELPEIHGEPVRLRQVIQNLLGNAIKYREPSRPLSIDIRSAKGPDGSWVLTITDNGTGFDNCQAESLFKLFHRGNCQENSTGYGIGLALCRRIVESLGGSLHAKGELGKGATFTWTHRDVRW